jgi:integrase
MPVLTDELITSLKPGRRAQRDVYDSRLTGLGVRVGRGGVKAYFVFWRSGGKNKRVTIGRASDGMRVDEARAIALGRLESVASAAEGSAAERRAPTFSYLVTQYFERHGPHKAEASLKQDRSLLRHIPKEWSGRLLTSFTRNEMSQLHSDIASKAARVAGNNGRFAAQGKSAANHVLRFLRALFNRAIEWNLMTCANPAAKLKLFKDQRRQRFLTLAEVQQLNAALMVESYRWRAYFPLLLYLGLRKSELLNLKWENVDLEAKELHLTRTKSGEPLVQPIPEPAMRIIEALPSRGGKYLFPGDRDDRPVVNPNDAWARIRERAGLPDVCIHSLRHSQASALIREGFSLQVVARILNHSSVRQSEIYSHLEQGVARNAIEATAAKLAIAFEQPAAISAK